MNLNILLVEDHPDTADCFARLLRFWGHRVTIAHTLRDARAATVPAAPRFDVLLSDLGLPDGDGCELAAELAAAYPLRAVAMTGRGDDHYLERAKRAGFSEYLLKPIGGPDLRRLFCQNETGATATA